MIYCLDPDEVIGINRDHCALTGEPFGVRDQSSLLAALARPLHGFGGHAPFPTPVEKAGALLESIVQRHPFIQGNKRTGWTVATTFLGIHGFDVSATDDDAVDLVLGTVKHHHDAQSVALWFADRIVLRTA